MAAKLIVYECESPDHQPSVVHPDKLTVHEGEWAFCPFDARAEGHRWKTTGGVDLESVNRRFGLTAAPLASQETQAAR